MNARSFPCFQAGAVCCHFQVMRSSGGADFLLGNGVVVFVISHYFDCPRFVTGVHPHEAVPVLAGKVFQRGLVAAVSDFD
jgi:hypothetical protein